MQLDPEQAARLVERGSDHNLHFPVMDPKEQFAMPSVMNSGVPSCGRRRKPALFTSLSGSVLKRLEATFTAWLDQNVEADGPPATDPQHVLGSIRAGDVVPSCRCVQHNGSNGKSEKVKTRRSRPSTEAPFPRRWRVTASPLARAAREAALGCREGVYGPPRASKQGSPIRKPW